MIYIGIFPSHYRVLFKSFELGIVILSLVPRFLKKIKKTQLLSAKKVESVAGNKAQFELKMFSKEIK